MDEEKGEKGRAGGPHFTCGWRGGGGSFDILGRWVFGWLVDWVVESLFWCR